MTNLSEESGTCSGKNDESLYELFDNTVPCMIILTRLNQHFLTNGKTGVQSSMLVDFVPIFC